MKFALAFLLGLVVISNQQFHQQPTNDRILWLLTYYSPTIRDYNYQPVNYDVSEDVVPPTFFKQLTPSSKNPIPSQVKAKICISAALIQKSPIR